MEKRRWYSEAGMVLKRVVPALAAVMLLAAGSVALADEEYRPSEFLGLDLTQAVLSPKRLGPPTEFAPVALQAEAEARSEAAGDHASEPYWAHEELDVEPREVAVQDVRVTHPHLITHEVPKAAAHLKPAGAARTKLAHRHRNALDAQARDVRIQKWPCRSGDGICAWR
jgi:hypothetical protein